MTLRELALDVTFLVNRPSDDPCGGPCVHITPITRILFGPKSVYEYRYWLTAGTAPQIAETLDLLIAKHDSETARLETPASDETPIKTELSRRQKRAKRKQLPS